MKFMLHCIVLMLTVFQSSAQKKIFTSNEHPRFDTEGKIVDAHDGRVIQFGEKFYWYGTRYGNTNGFTTANEYVCYSSTDLNVWKYEGALLQDKPEGVYYRPHVVYNPSTKKYVLWYNWYPKLWNGQFGVATSNSPTGPFTVLNNNVQVKQSSLGVGDLGIFVDNDNKAYLSYNTIQNHKVSVELLTDDFTGSTLTGSENIAEHCEAGSMFKRNGIYYLLTDYTCCFCTQGSGAKVFTSTSPLGPYTYRQNINRYPGISAPLLKDGDITINQFEVLNAREDNGIEIWLDKSRPFSVVTIHQFTGNRSGQCGEVDNPVVHQSILSYTFNFQFLIDGEWQVLTPEKMHIKKTNMLQTYTLVFKQINVDRIKIKPSYTDSTNNLHLTEIVINEADRFSIFKTTRQEGKPIIPAQQAYVLEVNTKHGKAYSWIGDLWGSASDNIKGHDYQFWSAPLSFYPNGMIKPLHWTDDWKLKTK